MKKIRLYLLHYVCLLVLVMAPSISSDQLYVFTANDVNVLELQENLRTAIPGVDIEVFGRYRDFVRRVETVPPTAVLTKPELVSALSGYTPQLEGTVSGSNTIPYVLLSVEEPIDLSALSGLTIAGVDFMGRAGMTSFITKLIGGQTQIRLVAKIQDLLPLLTFDMAQGVLLPHNSVNFFRSRSNIELVVTELSNGNAGIMVLGVKDGSDPTKLKNDIKSLSTDINNALEVEAWR